MASKQYEILVIEDDAALPSSMGVLLRSKGYSVAVATNGSEGFKMATGHAFDLILLDIMLPDSSGLNVCRDIRQAGIATPILILTARTHMTDKLLGFRLGADDYVMKPFDTAELLARIEALLSSNQEGVIKVDVRRSRVTRNGKPVYITANELQLLHYLVKRSGRCVSRGELLTAVWGYASNFTTRTVDMHISSLRKKLESNPKFPKLILTMPKVGYIFVGFRDTYHRR